MDEERKRLLASLARTDSPEGYEAFYELIRGFRPPAHICWWARGIFKARFDGKGEAFRLLWNRRRW